MSQHDEHALQRRKPRVLRYLLIAFGLLIAFLAYQLLGPNPPIRVAPQTTYITSPLRADGLPDYPQYYRTHFANIAPSENAAVLLWQAIEPKQVPIAEQALVAKELGLPNALYANRITPYRDESLDNEFWHWYSPTFNAETFPDDEYPFGDACEQILLMAQQRPWRREEVPPYSKWLDSHEPQLELIVAASHRPKLSSPSLELLRQDSPLLLKVYPSFLRELSTGVVKGLGLRAMRHLGEGRSDDAWSDILALYRLANLLHQGHSSYERQMGFEVEQAAYHATIAFLLSAAVTPDQRNKAIGDLAKLNPLPSLAPCVDQHGRVRALDAILQLHLGNSMKLAPTLELGGEMQVFDHVSVDWNYVMGEVNRWFDRQADALRQPAYQLQTQAVASVHRDVSAASAEYENGSALVRIALSRPQRSRLLALLAFSMLQDFPPLQEYGLALSRRAAIPLVDGLVRYHAATATYPKSLSDLVPNYLPSVPIDPYTGLSFAYHPTSNGFLLYSLGDNGADDGGSHNPKDIYAGRPLNGRTNPATNILRKKIPSGADDEIILRVPTPRFKLPSPLPNSGTP